MGLLAFALNVTLDGCCDHREGIADDELLGLIDEYRLVVHPVIASHGPTLFQGLEPSRRLELVSTNRLKSGQVAMYYRRKE